MERLLCLEHKPPLLSTPGERQVQVGERVSHHLHKGRLLFGIFGRPRKTRTGRAPRLRTENRSAPPYPKPLSPSHTPPTSRWKTTGEPPPPLPVPYRSSAAGQYAERGAWRGVQGQTPPFGHQIQVNIGATATREGAHRPSSAGSTPRPPDQVCFMTPSRGELARIW